ncbi:3-oxoacyl-(Acyl-carrier-protein) reductase [Sphingobium chlorophenolicum]|uniref:3-oxoacyl-(Acyl-carrier-protein) reductase n=2 Tax=Sphingobium chlorophenolicum TaxID=46429 RepID=A0A081R9Z8_SPHCR|nr:3-oxoacyl-(Acyl-carrier-protein) reductase [Sphingobium chlorophenolicum]
MGRADKAAHFIGMPSGNAARCEKYGEKDMSFGLEDKVAIVTGGASGIGEASTRRLISAGAKVCIVDMDGDAAEKLAGEIGSRATAIVADISDAADVERATQAALSAFGRIDLLHSNAGIIGEPGPIAGASAANFDRVFSVNVRSAVLMIGAVVPEMRRQGGGSIVITASVGGVRPSPGLGIYAASKLALVALAKTAAVELGVDNIRVNAIAPGLTDTPAFRATRQIPAGEDEGIFDNVALPLGRVGSPAEVANMVAWLFGDEASYVTGGLYHVDGGLGI